MPRLLLWDIDHTLIATGGVGRELSAAAFEQVTGEPVREQAAIDGITEAVIFRETAKLHGLTTDRRDFERFAQALAEQHLSRLQDLRERGSALAGAAAALEALAAANVRQTVVSGNVRSVAEIKLNVFGLDTWLADAYLTAGEIEQAAAMVGRALELSTGIASIRPRQRIAPLLDQLRPHTGLAAVRDLLEQTAG
ncbi:haloacid dehalogenase-like hydrolase [Streptomyces sp. NPDC051322]|uniref:haloacid dehalogenase-like hydrolase n=1 Tax=Streptomyces sp. NPDC051322 TaxID=3154645 RepID=UPI003450883E